MKLFTLTQIPVYLVICYSAGKLWGESAGPSGYAAIAVLPTAFDTLNYVATGIGSLIVDDGAYTKNVSMLKDLSTTTQIVFRTSTETSPTVYYLALGV